MDEGMDSSTYIGAARLKNYNLREWGLTLLSITYL